MGTALTPACKKEKQWPAVVQTLPSVGYALATPTFLGLTAKPCMAHLL